MKSLSNQNIEPFKFNFHAGDVEHTLIFGPTGAGKSIHSSFMYGKSLAPVQDLFSRKGDMKKIQRSLRYGSHFKKVLTRRLLHSGRTASECVTALKAVSMASRMANARFFEGAGNGMIKVNPDKMDLTGLSVEERRLLSEFRVHQETGD